MLQTIMALWVTATTAKKWSSVIKFDQVSFCSAANQQWENASDVHDIIINLKNTYHAHIQPRLHCALPPELHRRQHCAKQILNTEIQSPDVGMVYLPLLLREFAAVLLSHNYSLENKLELWWPEHSSVGQHVATSHASLLRFTPGGEGRLASTETSCFRSALLSLFASYAGCRDLKLLQVPNCWETILALFWYIPVKQARVEGKEWHNTRNINPISPDRYQTTVVLYLNTSCTAAMQTGMFSCIKKGLGPCTFLLQRQRHHKLVSSLPFHLRLADQRAAPADRWGMDRLLALLNLLLSPEMQLTLPHTWVRNNNLGVEGNSSAIIQEGREYQCSWWNILSVTSNRPTIPPKKNDKARQRKPTNKTIWVKAVFRNRAEEPLLWRTKKCKKICKRAGETLWGLR